MIYKKTLKGLVLSLFSVFFFVFNSFSQNTPTLVIYNAKVHTVDVNKPKAEAFAVTGNKISAIGSNAEIRKLIGETTKTIDARGKLILPGFNDPHVHFFSVGSQFFSMNLKDVKTPNEVLAKMRFYVEFLPQKEWIRGGFQTSDDSALPRMPSKELVDEITPNHPALLYLKGAEIAFANSVALKIARIDKNTQDPQDGLIVRDESGEPTGILYGKAINLVSRYNPIIRHRDYPPVAETATNYAASVGVTSVQDVHSDDSLEIYRNLEKQGKLKNRVYDCISLIHREDLIKRGIKRATGDGMLREGCVKHFAEGDIEWENEEFAELFEMIDSADKADLQVMIHAIGSRPNDMALKVFEKIVAENGDKDRRFRIEHAHNFRQTDIERFIKTKTIPSFQPYLFFNGSDNYSFLLRQMLDKKAFFVVGTDASFVDLNPLLTIWATVYKNNRSEKGITVEEAVRAYTLDSAYAEFQEDVKGSITVGKLADFVILSDDIFTINPDKIKDVKVLQTYLDGKLIYQKNF